MIQSHELRLGNWVMATQTYSTEPFPIQIDAISVFDKMQDLQPIPLTPEILEKAGFVKDGFHSYNLYLPNKYQTHNTLLCFSGDYLYLRQEINDNRFDDSVITLWNKDLMKVFYVHNLQNLYFALTGTELTINL